LFEAICEFNEDFLAIKELGIMGEHSNGMAQALGVACMLIELGT